MKNEVKINEFDNTRLSVTGKIFIVYINGERIAIRTTREEAEEAAKKILEKKTYR